MSTAWTPSPWDEGPDRPARLPRIEDLASVEGGYDRASVESAFAAFHDHAAKLDRTLDVLQAVAAFHDQADNLRADIRALRAAAWGPLPVPRSSCGAAYATRSAARSAALPAALPRLAVEAAFIILVAVGAALAEVSTAVLAGLVLGSWLIVGLIEVLVASTRAQRRVVAPAPVPAGPMFVPQRRVRTLEDTQEEAVVFEPAPELEAELELESELAGEEEYEELDDDEEDEDVLPPAAEGDERAEGVADPWADGEEPEDEEVEPEVSRGEAETGEQPALVALVAEPEPEAEGGRRRFWHRKTESSPPEPPEEAPAGERDSLAEARTSSRRGRR